MKLKPPFLRYGWHLGERRLMEIIQQQFPDCVVTSWTSFVKNYDPDFEDEYGDLPVEDDLEVEPPYERPSPSKTFAIPELHLSISQRIGSQIPGLLSIDIPPNKDRKLSLGLTVGMNYKVILNEKLVKGIQEIFAPGEEPM
jgi:hypothetical protein